MAVELSKYLKEQLSGLSLDHPDRSYLTGLLMATEGYLAKIDMVAISSSVDQAAEAYKFHPHTPELVTKVHRTIWHERGKRVDMVYEVPSCPYTQMEITELEQQTKIVGYLPPELATQQSRHLLGKIFPLVTSPSVREGNAVTNDENPSGWFDYDAGIDAPYLGTNEKELKRVAGGGRELMSLNQYIVAGQDSKLLTRQYLDEGGTWVRLGSRDGGFVVFARFGQDGYLNVGWNFRPDSRYPHLGGRSSGVKKA